MSSSDQPSPSRASTQTRPVSGNGRQQIRLVPYSPPRPDTGASGNKEASQSTEDVRDGDFRQVTRKASAGTESFTSESSSASSTPSSPTNSLARTKGRSFSAVGTSHRNLSTPASRPLNKASYGSTIRHVEGSSPATARDSESPSSAERPKSRRGREINLHSDNKTFSLVLKPVRRSDRTDSTGASNPFSNASTSASHTTYPDVNANSEVPSSPPSSIPERSVSPATPRSPTIPEEREAEVEASPWNYRMSGGLRKVPRTPDLHNKGKERDVLPAAAAMPALPEADTAREEPLGLVNKSSFNSDSSESSVEEGANYKVVGCSSPPAPYSESIAAPPSSPSESNYEVLGASSPPQHLVSSPAQAVLDTPGSKNFITHGGATPSSFASSPRRPRPQYSDDSLSEQIRGKYSQESLVVPPLQPRRLSFEKLGYYKKLSKESLRGRANSFSSLSSIITQDTASLFLASSPNVVQLNRTPSNQSLQRRSWADPTSSASSRPRIEAHPHQWSSQLSTVMSEYEGSDAHSRVHSSTSLGSRPFGSRGSSQMLSLSSLSMREEEPISPATPSLDFRLNMPESPRFAYIRGSKEPASPPPPTIRDHDEDGDGLADLNQHPLQHKPSWRGYLGRRPSDRDLHSSASAASANGASLPMWARFYYGSGERQWLASQSIRTYSESGDSRPGSSWAAGSPAEEGFQRIFSPRRRPRDPMPPRKPVGLRKPNGYEQTSVAVDDIPRPMKKKTSSIWSPHLRLDRRATRYSVWEPPSVAWSAESGLFGRRNIQLLLFVIGFVNPFAWIAASFLPLPYHPGLGIAEKSSSTAELGMGDSTNHLHHFSMSPEQDANYHSAKWWRNLNRAMSIFGLILFGVVAALVVVGIQQQWGH